MVDIEQAILSKDIHFTGKLTLQKIKEAIVEVDPQKSSKEMSEYIARGSSSLQNVISWDKLVDLEVFLRVGAASF